MLCSDCAQFIRPVVAIDIDGTIADYHVQFGRMACGYWNLDYPATPWDGSGEFEHYLGMSKEMYREAKTAYRQGGFKRVAKMFDSAVYLVNSMWQQAEVWITTTRPWNNFDSVDPDTRFWLERNGFHYHHLLYGANKFEDLNDRVGDRVVGVIDDLPENYDAAEALWPGVPLLVSRPHNITTRGERRATTLYAATDIFADRIRKWNSEH